MSWSDDDEVTTTYGSIQKALKQERGAERERIIALLEGAITHDWKKDHCEACDQTDYLVALIKGENE